VYVVEGVGFHRLFSNVSMISHVKPSCEAAEAGNSQEAYFSNLKPTNEAAKRGRACFQEADLHKCRTRDDFDSVAND
jgi:hypothetical protein